MSDSYTIVFEHLSSEEIVRQIRAINTFPCSIRLYDRAFPLKTKDEAWALGMGLEVGWYLSEEFWGHEIKKL